MMTNFDNTQSQSDIGLRKITWQCALGPIVSWVQYALPQFSLPLDFLTIVISTSLVSVGREKTPTKYN